MQTGDQVYLVKHALTRGVEVVTLASDPCKETSLVDTVEHGKNTYYRVNKDLVFTLEEAEIAFEQQKQAKIKNLQRQIAKLEQTSFEVKPNA